MLLALTEILMFDRSLRAQLAQLEALDDKGVPVMGAIHDLNWKLQQRSLRWQLYRFTLYVQEKLGYA